MCVVCILIDKEKLTIREAKKALWELAQEDAEDLPHLQELYAELEKKEREIP